MGKDAWQQNLQSIIFAADKVRSTFGPKGAYKMVIYNKGPEQVVKIMKDAIAILDELAIQYPPSVIIAESAKMQREEAGDGVASFVIFLSALLKSANKLMDTGFHANTIIHGYNLALERALNVLDNQGTRLNDDILDTVDCGRNLLFPNLRLMIRDAYVQALDEGTFDREGIRFLKKKGGSIKDSNLVMGVVLKRDKAHPNMPDRLTDLRIAITSKRLGIDRLSVKMRGEGPSEIKLNIKSADQISRYREVEKKLRTQFMQKLDEQKINVLLCEQPIEEEQKTLLLSNGIFALERVEKKDSQAVAKATGAKIVGNLKELTNQEVGLAQELFVDKIELEKTVTFKSCKGATFLLRGNLSQEIDELEVAIRNSMTILKLLDSDNRVLAGGGAIEMQLAEELKQYAKTFSSKEQIVIEAFADALVDIPRCLAENYGLNPTDVIIQLKQGHAEGLHDFGVSDRGCKSKVCSEPIKVKRSILRRGYEVSSLILKIDELLISKDIAKFHKK